MKVVTSLLLFALCAAAVFAQGTYDSSSDNLDVTELLQNERLLKSYAKCLIDKGPCTAEIKKVKEKLPEALATRCAKCTERQKELGKILVREVKKSHPDIWKQLVAHYDPDGKYRASFDDYLKP